jgi:hypothetical protein
LGTPNKQTKPLLIFAIIIVIIIIEIIAIATHTGARDWPTIDRYSIALTPIAEIANNL